MKDLNGLKLLDALYEVFKRDEKRVRERWRAEINQDSKYGHVMPLPNHRHLSPVIHFFLPADPYGLHPSLIITSI